MTHILGIDVGGSGIKGALVDLERGEAVTKRKRIKTPASFGLDDVAATIARLVRKFDYSGPVGVGFPAAVAGGVVLTPPTAHHFPGWVGQAVDTHFSEATGCPVTVLNDADAAGLAEMATALGDRRRRDRLASQPAAGGMRVRKRSGALEPVDVNKIVNAIARASEGLLGVITEISVKLLPAPEHARVILAAFDSVEAAGAGEQAALHALVPGQDCHNIRLRGSRL
mgnify:CR=1 FL=1